MKKELIEKLQEIGFNPEPPILETILEALPEEIEDRLSGRECIFRMTKKRIVYIGSGYGGQIIIAAKVDQQKDESLADTAARLLILLESKNLVKFK